MSKFDKYLNKPTSLSKKELEKYIKNIDKNKSNWYGKPAKKKNPKEPAKTFDVLQVSAIMRFMEQNERIVEDLLDSIQTYAVTDIDTAAFSLGNESILHVVAFRVVIRVADAPAFLQLYGSWLELNNDLVLLQDMDVKSGTAQEKDNI